MLLWIRITTTPYSNLFTAFMSSRTIVQYVLLRKDLNKLKSFKSKGSIVAQACHASIAAIYKSLDTNTTKLYTENLDQMTKTILSIPNEESLIELSKLLKEKGVGHVVWKENPEEIYTALAIYPTFKDEVEEIFKPYKLY